MILYDDGDEKKKTRTSEEKKMSGKKCAHTNETMCRGLTGHVCPYYHNIYIYTYRSSGSLYFDL